jgi:23S rRNA (guanine745-N1)-methyltransferase
MKKAIDLLCTVRGCGAKLEKFPPHFFCAQRHCFDIARQGYVNLLQPQDRRSLTPGDPTAVVAARQRLLASTLLQPFQQKLLQVLLTLNLPAQPTILDVGCGEGTYLNQLTTGLAGIGYGIDISTPAILMAARQYPRLNWVVANADRMLPYAAQSFNVVMSITARRNGAEFQRVLAPDGWLVLVIPQPDDLLELRAAIFGDGQLRDRRASAQKALEDYARLVTSDSIKFTTLLTREQLQDVLLLTYRGNRYREQARVAALANLQVTWSYEIMCWQKK